MVKLTVRKGYPEPKIEIFREDDMALVQYAPMPDKPLRDEFIGDFLIAHVSESDEIISVTVIDLEEFSRKAKSGQPQTKRHWLFGRLNESTQDIADIIPKEMIYQLGICA